MRAKPTRRHSGHGGDYGQGSSQGYGGAQGYGAAQGRREPDFAGGSPRLFGDFASIEAGLRGSIAPDDARYPAEAQQYADAGYDEHGNAYGADPYYGQGWDGAAGDPAQYGDGPQQKPASKRPMYLMAATIAVGVIGIGAAFALKGHVSSSPREIKTIMADAGPTKVAPPPDASGDAGGQDPTLLGKTAVMPTSLVNREEQPVDLSQAVQDNRARAAQMNPATMPTSVTDASTVPVPPSPRQMQTAMADPQRGGRADAGPARAFGLSDMPAPKRVKVVSVRPDGTILPNDQPPAAAMPAPRQAATKTSDKAGPVAKASTPKVPAAKTTSRATATPKSIEALAAGDDAPAATAEAKPAKKAKPQRVASADTGEKEAAAEPAPVSGAGGFAVQLAAPGSEADAKATSARLSKTYADALGSFHLGFHKAENNGKSVYRVRVSSLSRTEAVGLCEKLKAKGGSCFVAKN